MKILANENFPRASVLELRRLGYDVTSIGEDDPSISDSEVIQLANKENRLIVTFDGELIFKHKMQPVAGVIYLRLYEFSPESPAGIVDSLLKNENLDFNRHDGL